MADEDLWRRRFFLFMGARLVGLATFVAGVTIALTDLVREGGLPVIGAIVAILGLVDAFAAPVLMKKKWKAEDEGR